MKKLMSKVVVLILIMLMFVISIVGNSYASNDNKYSGGMISLDQINETFLREYILKHLPKDAKLISVEISVVYFNSSKDILKPVTTKPPLEPQWGFPHYYITNVKELYKAYGTYSVAKVIGGSGPATVHMSQSEEISNSFSATAGVSVSPKIVTAGMGFDVTKKYIPILEHDLSIPAGCYGTIEAHPIYDVYNYDVMYKPFIGSPYNVGSGNAKEAVGVFYLAYIWK